MEALGYCVLAATAVNFAAFIVGGKLFFDGSRRKPSFTLFAVTFVSLCCATAALQWFFPQTDKNLQILALALAAASFALFAKTVATTRAHPFAVIYSDGGPTQLVTMGPYRYVRHPFYTAYLLSFAASAIACSHLAAWGCAMVAAAIYTTAARAEEQRFLASPLKDAYAAFRARTGMFWPTTLRGVLPSKQP